MSDTGAAGRSAIVFGARNLGRTVIRTLLDEGWAVTAVARSQGTLEAVREDGALALRADVTDPASVEEAFCRAADAHGAIDLAVNAASPSGVGRSGPFGGGPLVDADPGAFDAWTVPAARGAFAFLSAAGRFALGQGRPATLVQVTGGSTRRAIAGRGAWAAGAFAVRALTNAAALELRGQGIQVTLLIVDAAIEPFGSQAPEATRADPRQIAEAVRFLADQDPSAATHELTITPLRESWTP